MVGVFVEISSVVGGVVVRAEVIICHANGDFVAIGE